MQTEIDLTKVLQYKLRVMGAPIDGPASIFFDNKSVVTSRSVPTSTLVKKHLIICYHAVRESVDAGIHWIAHIVGEFNPADVLTNILMTAAKRPHTRRMLY